MLLYSESIFAKFFNLRAASPIESNVYTVPSGQVISTGKLPFNFRFGAVIVGTIGVVGAVGAIGVVGTVELVKLTTAVVVLLAPAMGD